MSYVTRLEIIDARDVKPSRGLAVLVEGGVATWDGEVWRSLVDGSSDRPIAWEVTWWAMLPHVVIPQRTTAGPLREGEVIYDAESR